MEYVLWKCGGAKIPMVKDENGWAYCLTETLQDALGFTDWDMKKAYCTAQIDLHSIEIAESEDTYKFFHKERKEFTNETQRGLTKLWTERAALAFIFAALNGVMTDNQRRELLDSLPEITEKEGISEKRYEEMRQNLKNERPLIKLKELI